MVIDYMIHCLLCGRHGNIAIVKSISTISRPSDPEVDYNMMKEKSFSAEGLVNFSAYTLGLLGVLFGRFGFGLSWTVSALLYIPSHGIVCGVVNNASKRIVGNAVILLLFPILTAGLPDVVSWLLSILLKINLATPASLRFLSELGVALIGFFVLIIISRLVVACSGDWHIPESVHQSIVRVLAFVSCTIVLVSAIFGIRMLDGGVLKLGMGMKLAMALVPMGIYLLYVYRIVSMRFEAKAGGGGDRGKPLRKTVVSSASKLANRPTTKLADVAGMEEVKEQVRLRIIEPMLHPKLAGRYGLSVGGGMLLYGPPGTGKTFFARAVAGELELPFYMVTAADVFGKHVGESERNIRKLFNDIRNNPLSVVFIDELETLFPKRTEEVHETTRKVISLLLQELDGIDKSKNPILLLGATNVPWMIDEAFMRPGRFDVKAYVGLPNFDARRQMLIAAFDEGDVPHEPGLTAHMAEKTEGYSGADLRGVMARMRQVAFDRRLECYTYAFADEILAMTSPTTAPETVARIQQWEKSAC